MVMSKIGLLGQNMTENLLVTVSSRKFKKSYRKTLTSVMVMDGQIRSPNKVLCFLFGEEHLLLIRIPTKVPTNLRSLLACTGQLWVKEINVLR
jgi:hypothetical protein